MQAFFPDFSQNAPAWCENRENHKIRAARSFFSVDFLSEKPYNGKRKGRPGRQNYILGGVRVKNVFSHTICAFAATGKAESAPPTGTDNKGR